MFHIMFSFADGYDGITSFSASECTCIDSLLLALVICVLLWVRVVFFSILPFNENSQCLSTVKGILIASVSLVFRLATIAKMQYYLNGNGIHITKTKRNSHGSNGMIRHLHMCACAQTSRYGIFGSYRFHQFTS